LAAHVSSCVVGAWSVAAACVRAVSTAEDAGNVFPQIDSEPARLCTSAIHQYVNTTSLHFGITYINENFENLANS